MKERVAVIDLGTNTFHLLVAEVNDGEITVIHRERQAVKIGMGGINQGMIREEAIQRTLDCLKQFKSKLDRFQVGLVRALGTSALRSAANGETIIRTIAATTGIDVEIINGEQEAEYIYYGVRSAIDLGTEVSLIVDIGGGSVEFIIANRKQIFWKSSIDIGAQRMLELYHRHDPMLPEEFAALRGHYHRVLSPLQKAMEEFKPKTVVGSSGTFDTLSEIHCQKNNVPYLAGQAETLLTVESFHLIHGALISNNRSERMKIPGMIEMRVDMIVVASCLIHYLVNHFMFQKIRVSSYSLKEGVLANLVSNL